MKLSEAILTMCWSGWTIPKRSYISLSLDDPSYSQLTQSLSENDIQSAFRAAHTLKGVSLSLGLTRLGNVSGAVCENLRAGIRPSDKLLKQLKTEYRGVIAAINSLNNSY